MKPKFDRSPRAARLLLACWFNRERSDIGLRAGSNLLAGVLLAVRPRQFRRSVDRASDAVAPEYWTETEPASVYLER